jgi:hypothetical protein
LKKLLLISLAACAIDDAAESTIESEERRCSLLVCGENAASAGDGVWFDEFDLFGAVNYAGVRLTHGTIDVGGTRRTVTVGVSLDELYMIDYSTWMVYLGWQLVTHQAQMHFHQPSTGIVVELQVTDYQAKIERFRSGADEYVPVYQFSVRRPADPEFDTWEPICNDADQPWAVVFRGDKYSPNLKVLSNDPSSGWSFLACNGSAAMKMHMHRHTYAGQFNNALALAYPTDTKKRTTLLKALTADYCGIGHSFTVTGTRLAYATSQDPGRFPEPYMPGDIDKFEAKWTPYGAACLDTPRRVPRAEVEATCPIMACGVGGGTPPPSWYTTHHVITAKPF